MRHMAVCEVVAEVHVDFSKAVPPRLGGGYEQGVFGSVVQAGGLAYQVVDGRLRRGK